MPCFSTIQWFSSETNGLRIAAAISGWLKAAERVADIVEQRAGDVLVVAPVLHREARGEKRMMQPIDRKAPEIAVKQFQVGDDSLGKSWAYRMNSAAMIAQSSAVDCSMLVNVAI